MEPQPTNPQSPGEPAADQPILQPTAKRVIAPLPGQVESLQPSLPTAPTAAAPVVTPTPTLTPAEPLQPISQPSSPPAAPVMNVTPPQPVESPVTPPAVVVGGNASDPIEPATPITAAAAPEPLPPSKKHSKKKLALLIGVPLLVVLLGAGAVFGLYLPNTPAAVWNTGVNRTGTALDKLVSTATTTDQIEKLSTSELSGSLNIDYMESSFSGDVTATFDKSALTSGLNVHVKDEGQEQTLAAKLLAKQTDNQEYPDLYFQLSGLTATSMAGFIPGWAPYDGKWIVANHDFIKSYADKYAGEVNAEDAKPKVTAADVQEVAQAATKVTQEYVFSTDEQKAVLVQKSFVGKEVVDGGNSYHYKANINKDHLKDYCVALAQAVTGTKAYRNITGQSADDVNKSLKNIDKDCAVDSTPKKDLDVWIGGKYRLIQKIRVHEDNGNSYVDIGQTYTGGDDVTLYADMQDSDSKASGRLSLTTNVKNYNTSLKLTGKGEQFSVELNLAARSSNKKVEATAPANPVPVQDLLNALNASSQASQAQAEARVQAINQAIAETENSSI